MLYTFQVQPSMEELTRAKGTPKDARMEVLLLTFEGGKYTQL